MKVTVDAPGWTLPPARTEYLLGESSLLYGVAFWLALTQVSIAASQIVLAATVLLWLYLAWRHQASILSLPFDVPFALYGTLTLCAAAFSFDPALSLPATKEILLLVVPYLLVSTIRRMETLESLVLVLVLISDVGAFLGLWQYRFGNLGDINHRIHGFMGHYMTYSGQLMGVSILALSLLLFSGRRARHRWFLLGSFLLIQLALALTLTRSAWIGMLAAIILLVWLKDRRLLAAIPLAVLAAAMILPRDVEKRVFTLVSPDTSGLDRIHMLRAGARMVANHPLLGVGPDMVAELYPVYVDADASKRDNPHLHNNLAQIAAERGLPCLAAWLWFMVASAAAAIRALENAPEDGLPRALSVGSLGVLLAALAAGMFEYNFGDSEFQMFFLFVVSIPLVLERHPGPMPVPAATGGGES
jgi:O-antigen ligase